MFMLMFHVATSLALANDEDALPMPIGAVVEDEVGDDDEDARGYTEIAEQIGLSDAQSAKVKEVIYAARLARIDQKAKSAKAKLELKQLLTASTLDEKGVNRALESYIAAEGELQRSKVRLLLDLRKQLDAEQWAKLVEMREARKGGRLERVRERIQQRHSRE